MLHIGSSRVEQFVNHSTQLFAVNLKIIDFELTFVNFPLWIVTNEHSIMSPFLSHAAQQSRLTVKINRGSDISRRTNNRRRKNAYNGRFVWSFSLPVPFVVELQANLFIATFHQHTQKQREKARKIFTFPLNCFFQSWRLFSVASFECVGVRDLRNWRFQELFIPRAHFTCWGCCWWIFMCFWGFQWLLLLLQFYEIASNLLMHL